MEKKIYTERDNMSELINANYTLLNVLSRFNISLGIGEKSIDEVCAANNVDTKTFLEVVNLLNTSNADVVNLDFSILGLLNYLKNSHSFFLEYRLPSIRKALNEATSGGSKDMQYLILNYFDEFAAEVNRHMAEENENYFVHLEDLVKAYEDESVIYFKYTDKISAQQHSSIEVRLAELIDIIVKYYPAGVTNELNTVLYDIFVCQQDLASHNFVEDNLLVPKVDMMIEEIKSRKQIPAEGEIESDNNVLSEREKDILVEIVYGLTNKEIANKLFLSVHTVNTHRKNIMNKLHIHSPAGLTIYAIANKLVSIEDIYQKNIIS